MFVDKAKVTLQAGKGGNGLMSFRREVNIPRGGPDGGDGGDGGNVIFRASNNENTLAEFRNHRLLKAGDGESGGKRKKHGKRGQDLKINLPVGTVVVDSGGNVLADLVTNHETVTVASGGKGGFGNAHFTSSTRQAPRVAELGELGEKLEATLELKMIADVGLVGLPNAGKSTLLSVVSHARPEIGDYPFTTLTPNLGVVDHDKTSLLLADIPGLIEGASQGKGLGDEFLRHVERTSVLTHLVDVYNDDVAAAYKTIQSELKAYAVDLSKRPQIVALTKTESVDPKKVQQKIIELKKVVPRGTPVLAISAVTREGLNGLLKAVSKKVEQAKKRAAKKPAELPVITLADDPEDWSVEKTKNGFLVSGSKIERFARRTRFGDWAGEDRLRDILNRTGVVAELEKLGAEAGVKIQIGNPTIGEIDY